MKPSCEVDSAESREKGEDHKVGRVLSFFYSRRNWDSPTPLAAGECASPPFGPGGRRARSLAGEGVEESQFRREDMKLWCSVYKYSIGKIYRYRYLAVYVWGGVGDGI